jgi:hypothetical protein
MDKGCKLKPLKDGVKQLITQKRLPKMFDDWLMAIHDDGRILRPKVAMRF